MGTNAAIEFCLLPIGWWDLCLSTSDWASWVQAVGSLLGLAIAILVPLRMKLAEHQRQQEQDVARAHIAAAYVHLMITPSIGFLQAYVEAAKQIDPERNVMNQRDWCKRSVELVVPSEHQTLMLEPVDRDMALSVARGFGLVGQLKQALLRVQGTNERTATLEMMRFVGLAELAIGQLTAAAGRLDKFVTSLEGAEVIVPEKETVKS